MRLDEPDDDIGPALEAPPSLVQHGAGLAHAGSGAEVDPELAGRAYAFVLTRAGSSPPRIVGSARASVHSNDAPKERKAVTHVRPSGLDTKGNVPANRAGHRRHVGRPRGAAGGAAPLPGPPEHRHAGAGVRAARAGRESSSAASCPGVRRRAGGFRRSTTSSSSLRTTRSRSARLRTGSRSAVYVAVVLVVSQVVAKLRRAREEAERRTQESERLFELSQALIGDLTLSQLLMHIGRAPCKPSSRRAGRRWCCPTPKPPTHGSAGRAPGGGQRRATPDAKRTLPRSRRAAARRDLARVAR